MPVLLAPEQHWECPSCDLQDVTHLPADVVASRMHTCPGLAGLTAPMIPAGTRCKVQALERQDYTNGDLVTTDENGRVVMAVEVTREDGTDLAVYAPCATANGDCR